MTDAGADAKMKALAYIATLQQDMGDRAIWLAMTMTVPNDTNKVASRCNTPSYSIAVTENKALGKAQQWMYKRAGAHEAGIKGQPRGARVTAGASGEVSPAAH